MLLPSLKGPAQKAGQALGLWKGRGEQPLAPKCKQVLFVPERDGPDRLDVIACSFGREATAVDIGAAVYCGVPLTAKRQVYPLRRSTAR